MQKLKESLEHRKDRYQKLRHYLTCRVKIMFLNCLHAGTGTFTSHLEVNHLKEIIEICVSRKCMPEHHRAGFHSEFCVVALDTMLDASELPNIFCT